MNLRQFLLILRARYLLILAMLVVTVAATIAVSLSLPKQYIATAAVVVDVKSPDPVAGMYLPGLAMPGYMATQVDILNSVRVTQRVIKLANLDQDAKAKADWQREGRGSFETWLVTRVQRSLEIKPSRESNVINISYKAADPESAATIANAFAKAYIETVVELRVGPAREYARWFEEQGKVLRDNVESAQNRLLEYQQRKGIVATDERLDNETAKLNELSTQLSQAQGQSADAQSKLRSGGGALPEVTQSSLITSLKLEISRLEGRLLDAGGNLGRNHPQYQRMESELAELKARLAAETRNISSGFSAARAVARDKEVSLLAAMEKQKQRLLELKRDRGELGVLQRDVEAAQKAYDAVSQRFNQASLESQSTQTNVAILSVAAAPASHASPKTTLNTLAAIFLGALLGVGAAFLLEFLDRRVRSVDDLSEILQLPALGVIPQSPESNTAKRLPSWPGRPALPAR